MQASEYFASFISTQMSKHRISFIHLSPRGCIKSPRKQVKNLWLLGIYGNFLVLQENDKEYWVIHLE